MKIILLALCDYAEISKNGKLTLAGIKHKIAADKIPGIKTDVYFGAIAKGKVKSSVNIDMVIVDPNGINVLRKKISFDLGENGKSNLVIRLNNFKITSVGKYYLIFYSKNKSLGQIEFEVIPKIKKRKTICPISYTQLEDVDIQ